MGTGTLRKSPVAGGDSSLAGSNFAGLQKGNAGVLQNAAVVQQQQLSSDALRMGRDVSGVMDAVVYALIGFVAGALLVAGGLKFELFDFSLGGEQYKKEWCDKPMPLYEVLESRSVIGMFYVQGQRLKKRILKNPWILDKAWKLRTILLKK